MTVIDNTVDSDDDDFLEEEFECKRCCISCCEATGRCCKATWYCRGTPKWHNPMSKGPGWLPFFILMYLLLGLWFAVLFPLGFCCIDICFFCHERVPSIKERRTKVTVVQQTQTMTVQPAAAEPPPPAYGYNRVAPRQQPSVSMQQQQSVSVRTHVERY